MVEEGSRRDSLEDRLPLLRNVGRPRTLHSQLRALRQQVGRLQRAGYRRTLDEETLAIGSPDLPASLPEASGGGLGTPAGGGGLVPPFENAEELWVGDGAATAKLLQMAINSVAVRRGAGLEALAVAASRILGRGASGNVKAMTGSEARGVTGALDVALNDATTRRIGSGSILSSDYQIVFVGSFSTTLPDSVSISTGKTIYFIRESGTLTVNAGSGQTINGAASKSLSSTDGIWRFTFDGSVARWMAGLLTGI